MFTIFCFHCALGDLRIRSHLFLSSISLWVCQQWSGHFSSRSKKGELFVIGTRLSRKTFILRFSRSSWNGLMYWADVLALFGTEYSIQGSNDSLFFALSKKRKGSGFRTDSRPEAVNPEQPWKGVFANEGITKWLRDECERVWGDERGGVRGLSTELSSLLSSRRGAWEVEGWRTLPQVQVLLPWPRLWSLFFPSGLLSVSLAHIRCR